MPKANQGESLELPILTSGVWRHLDPNTLQSHLVAFDSTLARKNPGNHIGNVSKIRVKYPTWDWCHDIWFGVETSGEISATTLAGMGQYLLGLLYLAPWVHLIWKFGFGRTRLCTILAINGDAYPGSERFPGTSRT